MVKRERKKDRERIKKKGYNGATLCAWSKRRKSELGGREKKRKRKRGIII